MGVFDALFGGPKFNASKCKTALRLCVGRVKLLRNKKANAVVNLKREIADLLNAGTDDSARVRVEAVLREEATLEAFEVLDLFCELLVVRLPLIESTKDLPADLKEAVATVVYAARRVADEIPELKEVKTQFAGKYGSQYVAACGEDATASACGVSELAMRKLALAPPSEETRLEALRTVAAERGARFDEAKMAEALEDRRTSDANATLFESESRGEDSGGVKRDGQKKNATFADAGQAAAAARAAAAEAAAAADAASRLAGRDELKSAFPLDAERTVGVITSRTPVPPPGFLVEALPPPNTGPGAQRGKSVSQVIGADDDDDDDDDDAATPDDKKKSASGANRTGDFGDDVADTTDDADGVTGTPSASASVSPGAPEEESAPPEEEEVSVPDYARPSPPPGVGGAPPPPPAPPADAPPPPDTVEETRSAEGDEPDGNDANEGEDFDALASRLAALKRRDDE